MRLVIVGLGIVAAVIGVTNSRERWQQWPGGAMARLVPAGAGVAGGGVGG